MHKDRAVRLDQQEPGGEGEMGFEPANIINGASGNHKSHAVHTTGCRSGNDDGAGGSAPPVAERLQ